MIAFFLASLAPVLAAQGAIATGAGMAGGPQLHEVIVTARKQEENILDVPVAVTAFSADDIDSIGLARLDELAHFVPGFSLDPGLGRQPAAYRPMFRGVTTVRNGVANANAGNTFIDGIYVGSALLATELDNLERVEIMRGPQSAQFGRNTYVGAVNYVSRRPSETLEGRITATIAQHDSHEASGWLSGPVGDGSSLRFALGGGHREYGGEWTNQRDGSDVGGEASDEASARLLWMPAEGLEVSLRLGWQHADDDHYAVYLQPSTLNNCCFRSAEAPRSREYYQGKVEARDEVNLYTDLLDANGGSGMDLDRRLGSLKLDWQLGGYSLTSLTGFIRDDYRQGYDTSQAGYDPGVPAAFRCGMPLPPALPPRGSFLLREHIKYDDLSQELRLGSEAARPLRFTLGAYYYRGRSTVAGRRRIDPCTGLAHDVDRERDKVENRALFGALAWDFRDDWTAGVELRWAEDEVTVTTLPVAGAAERYRASPDKLTPRFTLDWRALDSTSFYANVSRGTKAPDFNPRVPDESYRAVGEESAWNYELGMKSFLPGPGLSLALAAYEIKVRDQQVTQLVELPVGGTASILTNAGRTRVRGLEAEASAPIGDHLSWRATWAWTDSEIRDWISQEVADLRGSDGSQAQNDALGNVAGHHSPRVPRHMGSLLLRYERQLAGGMGWYANADWSFESSRYGSEDNLVEVGNRQLLGLRAGLLVGRWDVSLWVKNLLDDDTPTDVLRFFDGRYKTLPTYPYEGPRASNTPRGFAMPLPRGRQLGATAAWRF